MMEQVLAIAFIVVTVTVLIAIFAPGIDEAVCKKLRLSKWTPLSDDNLLLFVLFLPVWLFYGVSKLYWQLVEYIVTEPGDDELAPPTKAGFVVLYAALIIYVAFFIGPLLVLLRDTIVG